MAYILLFSQEQRIRGTEIEMMRVRGREGRQQAGLITSIHSKIITLYSGLLIFTDIHIWAPPCGSRQNRISHMYVDLIRHSLVARMCRVFRGNLK